MVQDTDADCLLMHVEGLHLMTKTGYRNRIELLQGTEDMLILKTAVGRTAWIRISQAIWENSGTMVATIEGIMGADGSEA